MKKRSLFFVIFIIVLSLGLVNCLQKGKKEGPSGSKLRFEIAFTEDQSKEALDGRMLLMISIDNSKEPRFQILNPLYPNTQQIFGIDVEGLKPGKKAIIDESVFGYPLKSISEIPPGEYWVQALLHRYETFHRADG